MSKKWLWIAVIIVIVAVIAVPRLLRKSTPNTSIESTSSETPISVETRTVAESRSKSATLTYPGRVESTQTTTVSAQVSGTASSVSVHLGDRVNAGQLLLSIEDTTSSLEPEQGFRNAQIQQAQLSVRQAKENYDQAKHVYDKDNSRANRTARDIAKLNYEGAQIALQNLIDAQQVKSPAAGTVTALNIASGESVAPNQTLLTISQPGNTKISFYISQAELPFFVANKKLSIVSGNTTLPGYITRISPQADPATGKFLVEATATGKDISALAVGTTVSVSLDTSNQTAQAHTFFVPLSTLTVGQNGKSIFILENNQAKRVAVETIRIDGGTAEVKSDGTDDASVIILTNVQRLEEGQTVAVQK